MLPSYHIVPLPTQCYSREVDRKSQNPGFCTTPPLILKSLRLRALVCVNVCETCLVVYGLMIHVKEIQIFESYIHHTQE